MKRRTYCASTVGTIALAAGCLGDGLTDGRDDPDSEPAHGTVHFYVSDDPNRIDDFEYLHVTVSSVSFKASNTEEASSDDGVDPGDDNDADSDGDDEPAGDADAEAATDQPDDVDSQDDEDDQDDGDDQDDESADASDDNDAGGPTDRGGWQNYDLDDPTVDLTELQGSKATLLDELEVPAGEYEAADLHVADIEAVLIEDLGGEETELKIPSERLQIRTSFTVDADEEIDFVYDIAPHKAGQSGKYILTPVISESGTDVDIEAVDARVDDE